MTKKLLYILFFFISCNQYTYVYSQITIASHYIGETVTTNATSFGTPSITLTAGKLYLFVGVTTGTTNNGSITATSTTWTNVINTGDATRRVQVFRCMPTSTATGESVQLGTFGGGSTGFSVVIYEITGVPATGTNGSDAIVQAVAGAATGANPSITMSAISNGQNAVMAFFGTNTNPPTGTVESGWTENRDAGYNTPTSGAYFMQRLQTTDNTPSFTAASSTWLGVGIELKSSARRLPIIN